MREGEFKSQNYRSKVKGLGPFSDKGDCQRDNKHS